MSAGLDASPAWKALSAHFASMKGVTMKDMFADDAERFDKFHLEFEEMLFDFSKNRINEETMKLLYALAAQQDVNGLAKKMYSGEKISEYLKRESERAISTCRVFSSETSHFCNTTCRHYGGPRRLAHCIEKPIQHPNHRRWKRCHARGQRGPTKHQGLYGKRAFRRLEGVHWKAHRQRRQYWYRWVRLGTRHGL